jgi:hypothetical protein
MDRQEVETALEAANVALSGRKRREASGFASVELREADPKTGRWELLVTAAVAVVTVLLVLIAWIY